MQLLAELEFYQLVQPFKIGTESMKRVYTLCVIFLSSTSVEASFIYDCYVGVGSQLNNEQKVKLCAGAPSNDPLRCFIEARNFHWNSDQRVRLCEGASSDASNTLR